MTDKLNLPALREAVAKMQLDYPVVYDAAEMRDGLGFVIVDADDGIQHEAYGEGIATLLNAAPALLDEVEAARAENAALKANVDDDTAIVSRARDICHRHGYVVDAEHEGWTTCALRSLEAEVAAARKVLETAIELPGYCAYAVIGVDAAAWQAWQARAGKEQA